MNCINFTEIKEGSKFANLPIFTARSSYASALLRIEILFVRLSVRHTRAL